MNKNLLLAFQRPCAIIQAVCQESNSEDLSLAEFPAWKVRLYTEASSLEQLQPLHPKQSKWLSGRWLAYLKQELPTTPTYWVELEHEQGHRLGLTVQILTFQAGRQIRQEEPSSFSLRRWLVRPLKFRALTLGQLLNSGAFGWTGPGQLAQKEWQELIPHLGEQLAKHFACNGVVLKDLIETNHPVTQGWEAKGYHPMPVDPVMSLPIRPHWLSMEDYLLDLSSKYRVRYRRTRREFEGISRRQLPLLEVRKRSIELDRLFQNVRSEAAFDPVDPASDYFYHLQKNWGNACEITGYFSGEDLLGFTTSLQDGDTLHAHYVGFDAAANDRYRLYHNMLFDLTETAIRSGVSTLNFARTAMEIKSSVGATSKHYAVLVKARSSLMNWVVGRFTPRLFKAGSWQPRNPFRRQGIVQLP